MKYHEIPFGIKAGLVLKLLKQCWFEKVGIIHVHMVVSINGFTPKSSN